jgi:uncharacterized membrane protein
LEIDTIAKGDGSRVVEPRRFVVRDPQSFAAVWSAHAGPDSPAPPVDFDTRMVAAVFAGQRPTPGFEVGITGTRREGDALVVIVGETSPDPSGVSAQVIVSPYHVVSLPRDDGEIRFDAGDPGGQATIIFKPPKPRIPDHQPRTTTDTSDSTDTTDNHGQHGQHGQPRTPRTAGATPPVGGTSSTGLTPEVAAATAYLAGPFSGALILATERTSEFVRFHAWQAVLALGVLGTTAVFSLVLAFALLIVSPTAFWVMLWLAAATGVVWIVLWAMCLVHAYRGRWWKIPFAGNYAERHASVPP